MAIEYYTANSPAFEFIFTAQTKCQYPWHIHLNHWSMGIILDGSALLGTTKNLENIGAGNFFIIPPHKCHCLHVQQNTKLITICLDASTGNQPSSLILAALQSRLLKQPLFYTGANRLMPLLIRAVHALGMEKKKELIKNQSAIQPAINMLTSKPEQKHRISCLAAKSGYSPWHFLRSFRKETGLTPHAFQLSCMVSLARTLLRQNKSTVEASLEAGFNDQSHMHKQFKKHHGLTPGEFVKANFRLNTDKFGKQA